MTASNHTKSKRDSWVAPRSGGYAARANGTGRYLVKKDDTQPDLGLTRKRDDLPPGRGSAAKSD